MMANTKEHNFRMHFSRATSYLHEVCGAGRPVRPVLGSHIQSLFPQLPSVWVLEATEYKHHPFQSPVEWDLGFSFLLFGFSFGFGQTLPLLVGGLRCQGSWGHNSESQGKSVRKQSTCCDWDPEWSVTFRSAGAGCAGWTRLVFGGCCFTLRWDSWTYFLCRRGARGGLALFAELKFSFWWLLCGNNSWKKLKMRSVSCLGHKNDKNNLQIHVEDKLSHHLMTKSWINLVYIKFFFQFAMGEPSEIKMLPVYAETLDQKMYCKNS